MRDPEMGGHPVPEAHSLEPLVIGRLQRRADFLRTGRGRRWHGKAMTLQSSAVDPLPDSAARVRIGFTLTRKVGCAVIRNRARRRLKEAVRLGVDLAWVPGHDYVIIGRIDAIRLPFNDLSREIGRAIRGVHGSPKGALPLTRPERTRPTS